MVACQYEKAPGLSMRRLTFGIIIALLFISDFTLLTFGLGSVFGGWRELIAALLVLWLVSVTFAGVAARGTVRRDIWKAILLVAGFVVLYLLYGDFSSGSVRMYRSFVVPILIGMSAAIWFQSASMEQKLGEIAWFVILMSLLTSVYAVYQYCTITQAQQFWYWPLLKAKGFDVQPYNSMRNGLPRVSGFFTGTLEFNAVILNTTAMILAALLNPRRLAVRRQYWLWLLLPFFLGMILIGSVRTALIGLVCVVMTVFMVRSIRSVWMISCVGYMQFFGLTTAIFVYLISGYTDDLSALDRVRQWGEILSGLLDRPMGYGFGQVGPGQAYWFDSLWLNLLATCGVAGAMIMLWMIAWYHKLVRLVVRNRATAGPWQLAMGNFLVAIYPFYLSSFFFQSYTNSIALYIFAIVLMVTISETGRARYSLGSAGRFVSEAH